VKGTKITPLEILTFKPRVKLRSKPAVIDETTTNADLTVTIKNANGIIGCDFTLNLNTGRPECGTKIAAACRRPICSLIEGRRAMGKIVLKP
jgi:hypothetical protein